MFEERCPKCGKVFITAPQHIFRDKNGFYCSWTCYNHRKDIVYKKRNPKQVLQYTESGTEVATFKDSIQAADHINGVPNGIRTACRNKTPYKGYLWRYKNDVS